MPDRLYSLDPKVENMRYDDYRTLYGWRKLGKHPKTGRDLVLTKSLKDPATGKGIKLPPNGRVPRLAHEELRKWMGTDKAQLPTDRKIRVEKAFGDFLTTGWGPRKKLSAGTLVGYESIVRLYALWLLGIMRVIDVEPQHIIRVLDRAKTPQGQRNEHGDIGFGLSESQIRNLYVALRSFFGRMCVDPLNYRPDNVVDRIGAENKPPAPKGGRVGTEVIFTDEEYDAIAANFTSNPRARFPWVGIVARMIFLFLTESGVRISEALSLRVSDVLYPKGHLHVVGGEKPLPRLINLEYQRAYDHRVKNPDSPQVQLLKGDEGKTVGTARRIPLGEFIAHELHEYIEAGLASGNLTPGGLLFPTTRQTMYYPGNFRDLLKAAAERAGLTRRVVPHFMRHTKITRLVLGGVDKAKVAAISGHDERVLEERYLHLLEDSPVYDEIADAGRKRPQGGQAATG